jgi:ribosomal protein S18 acetylase RimI-like enzyme
LSVIYEIFRPEDTDAMVHLLGEAFTRRDPPAVAVGLSAVDFESLVRLYCSKAAAEELTIVARESSNQPLAGVLLAEDYASPTPEGMDQLSAKFEPIFDILGQLETEYRSGLAGPRKSIHLFLLGVAEFASDRGVAQGLVSTCLENAARNGYQYAVTEATHPVSQHIFRKLGFAERVRRSYAEYRFDGQAPFASIANQGGPILMDKTLVE